MTKIDDIYARLRRIGPCRSLSDFSSNWLGREESYMRSLKSKRRAPSIEVYAVLAVRLRDRGRIFLGASLPAAQKRGAEYCDMADECVEELLRLAVAR